MCHAVKTSHAIIASIMPTECNNPNTYLKTCQYFLLCTLASRARYLAEAKKTKAYVAQLERSYRELLHENDADEWTRLQQYTIDPNAACPETVAVVDSCQRSSHAHLQQPWHCHLFSEYSMLNSAAHHHLAQEWVYFIGSSNMWVLVVQG